MSLADLLKAVRNAPFGCLAEDCDETRPTCAEIEEHMRTHPELVVTKCGCGQ